MNSELTGDTMSIGSKESVTGAQVIMVINLGILIYRHPITVTAVTAKSALGTQRHTAAALQATAQATA